MAISHKLFIYMYVVVCLILIACGSLKFLRWLHYNHFLQSNVGLDQMSLAVSV